MQPHPIMIEGPAVQPVTLADAKAHLRVEHAAEDGLIGGLILAAVSHLDGWRGALGRCIINQRWRLPLTSIPWPGYILLPFPDAKLVSIKIAPDGVTETTVDASLVSGVEELSTGSSIRLLGSINPASFDPQLGRVFVDFTAGFGAGADDVPAAIKQAILLMVGDMYRFTETAVAGTVAADIPVSTTVERLLSTYRRRWIS